MLVCVCAGCRMETEYDYLFKIVLIGDAGVGKTSIVRRYTDGIFTSAGIPTIGVDFCIKTLHIGSSAIKVSQQVLQVLFNFHDTLVTQAINKQLVTPCLRC